MIGCVTSCNLTRLHGNVKKVNKYARNQASGNVTYIGKKGSTCFFFFQKNFLGGYMVTFAFKQVKSTIIEVTFGLHEVTKNQKASIYNNFEKTYRLHFRIKSQLDQLFFKPYIKYTYPYFYTI